MRITGGRARGIPLLVAKGETVRPATDAMRQAVFSSIAAWVSGARFWDLFAGSGAYGLEAFSRGAASGTFVEKDDKAGACIRRNIAAVSKSLGRSASELQVVVADAVSVSLEGAMPDLVFIDPPYGLISEVAPGIFSRMSTLLANQPDPLIIFEMPGEIDVNADGWTCVKRLGKGIRQPTVCIFRTNRALT